MRRHDSKTIHAVRIAQAACRAADDHLNRAAARRARLYKGSEGLARSMAHRQIVEAHELLQSALERLNGQALPADRTPVSELVTIRPTDPRL